jgi:predicted nucleic acid-binding protein
LTTYVDTSFLVSLYSPDANSRAAAAAMRKSRREFLITTLGELELANALEVRVHRKEISRQQASGSRSTFEGDVSSGVWVVRSLTDQVFARALALSRQTTARLGTRTADLLHLAAALEFGCTALYSFDRQQRALARHMGLKLN